VAIGFAVAVDDHQLRVGVAQVVGQTVDHQLLVRLALLDLVLVDRGLVILTVAFEPVLSDLHDDQTEQERDWSHGGSGHRNDS